MEEWGVPEPQDDFENQYADELEMLDEMMEENGEFVKYGNPRSRKCLKFPTPDNAANDNVKKTIGKNGVSQAVKRQLDDMYALLSDPDDSDEEIADDQDSHAYKDSQAKRPRISTSPGRNTAGNNPEVSSSTSQGTPSYSPPQATIPRTKVFTHAPIGKPCIPLTGCDQGRRVYLSFNEDNTLRPNKADGKEFLYRKRPAHLLGVPFSVLKEAIYEQRRIKFLQESKRITDSLNDVLQDDTMNEDCNVHEESVNGVNDRGLWVDKYSPKSYVELLSDDGVNRNLLSWLKLWDCVVFGKEQPKKKKIDEKLNKEKKNNYNKEEDTAWMELDATSRPINKVALLCGPPGLGKTTLAHIVARHAGYSVVEMNASDDRSVDVFRNKIESSTQMQSVLDSGKKPNCLIIDEIDGAPTPAINVLLSLIKKKDSGELSSQTKRKKRKKSEMLSRPIICICNDPYVPALRLLREQAFVIRFPPTLAGRLAQRLMEVSKKELLQTDMTTLLALCEKAENDIRSCLNTLQFLRQKKQHLTLDYIQSATIGQKDSQKSLFSVWQAIFQLPRPKKKRFALLSKTPIAESNLLPDLSLGNRMKPEITNSAARFYNILHMASGNGQFKKIENGIFENYLNMKFKDAHLNLVVTATEWLEFNDLVSKSLLQQQHFVLMRYQPFLSVAFHIFFAGPSQPKLSYPSIQYENQLKETKTQNIMLSMLNDVSPHLRSNLDTRTLAVELLPLLLHIITPTLRPINTQLYSQSEKQQLKDLINTMISYNLTYQQERTIEGLYTYLLDPKIEDVVKYPDLPQHKQLMYATKQLIAREIALEKMRRMEKVLWGKEIATKEKSKNKGEQNKGKAPKKNPSNPVVLNLKPREVKPNIEKQEIDFFGRPIIPKPIANSNDSCHDNNQPGKSKSTFWFKFQKGFSNAVRRTIKIQDLL